MSIYDLLDQLEKTVEGSKRAFMQSDKVTVDKCLDQTLCQIPVCVEHADSVEEYGERHVLIEGGHGVTTQDTHENTDNSEGRKHDDRRNKSWCEQELMGT